MPSIDFARVKELIGVPLYLSHLGPRAVTWLGEEGRTWCPIHSRQAHPSRSFAFRQREWYCHKCKIGGGVLDLAMILMHAPLTEAARWLCCLCSVDVPYIPRAAGNRRPRNRKMAP